MTMIYNCYWAHVCTMWNREKMRWRNFENIFIILAQSTNATIQTTPGIYSKCSLHAIKYGPILWAKIFRVKKSNEL